MEIHEHPIVAGPVGEIRVPIDHRGLSRLLWPGILAALVCASLYLSFIHSETNFGEICFYYSALSDAIVSRALYGCRNCAR